MSKQLETPTALSPIEWLGIAYGIRTPDFLTLSAPIFISTRKKKKTWGVYKDGRQVVPHVVQPCVTVSNVVNVTT
jgi:hypothetical protein